MVTLKDHQQAMVDLLAHGSAIPASAMRLAHAMHDVLAYLNLEEAIHHAPLYGADATTPGLNDKALAGDLEACRPKDTMFDRARAAERRVKELENTVKQLRASNAKLKSQYSSCFKALEEATTDCQSMHYQLDCLRGEPEQAGCRKEDVQFKCDCNGPASYCADGVTLLCDRCGNDISDPAEVCEHEWLQDISSSYAECRKCGEVRK